MAEKERQVQIYREGKESYMSKLEFISRLRQNLAELPEEEIERALEYYEDYFDDSPKTEEEVIESLASPEEIAENIKKEILGKQAGSTQNTETKEEAGVFTERGFEMPKDRENYQEVDKFTQMAPNYRQQEDQEQQQAQKETYRYDERKERKKNRNFIFMLLIIFGCIWIVIFLLIAVAMFLFSFRKNSADEDIERTVKNQVVKEIVSEIEDAADDAVSFFDEDEEDDDEHAQHDDKEKEHTGQEYEEQENNETEETSSILSDNVDFMPNQNIQSLKIDFAVGKIKLCEGDKFSARITKNKNNAKIKSEVKNGVWTLKQKENNSVWDNLKHLLKQNAGVSITITVPKDFQADEIKIEIGAGTLKADSLTGKKIDLEVDTGSLKIDNLLATQEADLEVDMGSITISSGNIQNLNLECDMGKASYTGILTGKNKIECNMGSVDMTFENAAKDYTFSAENSMGKININGKSYSGLDSEVTTGNGTATVKLSVDMGTIKVKNKE